MEKLGSKDGAPAPQIPFCCYYMVMKFSQTWVIPPWCQRDQLDWWGRMSGSWVVSSWCGSVFKQLVVFCRHNFIALGRIFFFLMSHSVFPSFYITSHLYHHPSLLWPSEIMACLPYDRHWILALLSFSVGSPSGTLPQRSWHVWYALPCGVKSPQDFQKGSRQHELARQTQLNDGWDLLWVIGWWTGESAAQSLKERKPKPCTSNPFCSWECHPLSRPSGRSSALCLF